MIYLRRRLHPTACEFQTIGNIRLRLSYVCWNILSAFKKQAEWLQRFFSLEGLEEEKNVIMQILSCLLAPGLLGIHHLNLTFL